MMRRFIVIALVTCLATPASAEQSWSEMALEQLGKALEVACDGQSACLAKVAAFAAFLWNNRDEADIQARAVRCVAQTAVTRGYLWSPSKILDDLTPETISTLGIDLCECVVPELFRERVCGQLRSQ